MNRKGLIRGGGGCGAAPSVVDGVFGCFVLACSRGAVTVVGRLRAVVQCSGITKLRPSCFKGHFASVQFPKTSNQHCMDEEHGKKMYVCTVTCVCKLAQTRFNNVQTFQLERALWYLLRVINMSVLAGVFIVSTFVEQPVLADRGLRGR